MSKDAGALTPVEATLMARVVAQGTILELMFGTYLADRDRAGAEQIIEALRRFQTEPGLLLSHWAAVSWSDVAVQVPEHLEHLIARSLRVTEGLRALDEGRNA